MTFVQSTLFRTETTYIHAGRQLARGRPKDEQKRSAHHPPAVYLLPIKTESRTGESFLKRNFLEVWNFREVHASPLGLSAQPLSLIRRRTASQSGTLSSVVMRTESRRSTK